MVGHGVGKKKNVERETKKAKIKRNGNKASRVKKKDVERAREREKE